MFDVEAEIRINHPLEDVFSFVADSRNDPQWAVPVVECTQVAGAGPGLGAQYTFASKVMWGKARGQMEVVVYEPPRRIEWEMQSSVNSGRARISFKSEADSTLLSARSTLKARAIFRLTESIMAREIHKAYQQQLQNLKELLESK
jgi:uncharacterized protein YndB with AHSA1/START domain